MNRYLKYDEWNIIEEGFNPENHRSSESIFSLGNGKMGQRANFEEFYSGDRLQGSYIAGVYYPDKTRVGWWKNGYPEYFAKVLNAPDWTFIDIYINNIQLDLARCEILSFKRILNMKEGFLERKFIAKIDKTKEIKVSTKRFLSIVDTEVGAIRYSITPLNFDADITFTPLINGDVRNEDANYGERFWDIIETKAYGDEAYLLAKTKKTDFYVGMGIKYEIELNGDTQETKSDEVIQEDEFTGHAITIGCHQNQQAVIYKYISVLSSLNHCIEDILPNAQVVVKDAKEKGFYNLLDAHANKWEEKWSHSDIKIKGDIKAQQAIRFNIFQLNQTYTGEDSRLNIGPKGFTGEKYGGSTYWDTEAFCVPFYLGTARKEVTRNLLLYRYKQLDKAIENAHILGFKSGAALYPMVTMNGEECHNEWEITFEEIHRNGAIAMAIYKYINYTGDISYIEDYGIEVLIAIARFWKQRVNFSKAKDKYVILGVTGPNEYENNINNNWYTNTIAAWCLNYVIESLEDLKNNNFHRFKEIVSKTNIDYKREIKEWKNIVENMYFPYDKENKLFLQQEGYMDKEQINAEDIPSDQRPINQHWSWDRILRSCFIKQADVVQGLYFFEENYDTETIKRNFDFYEKRTVHESSLSPCIYSVIASKTGDIDNAYELYLRTTRLDLDDYNNEVNEGLHITSMAGTWISIVEGFGGMRTKEGSIQLNPLIPNNWKSYSFNINFRENILNIEVTHSNIKIKNDKGEQIIISVNGKKYIIEKDATLEI